MFAKVQAGFRETGKGAAAPRAGESGEPLREQQCGKGCLMVGNHG